jgi:N,N-dimethylformamidase
MVPLIGYLDRFSTRPGEGIAVKVSSQFAAPYTADLVRIIHGDANPAGPGIKIAALPAAFAGEYPSRSQPVHSGSCAIVAGRRADRFARPLHDRRSGAALAARRQDADRAGDRRRAVAVGRGRGRGAAAAGGRVQIPAPMLTRRWYELRVVASDGRLRFRQTAVAAELGRRRFWRRRDAGAPPAYCGGWRSAPVSPPIPVLTTTRIAPFFNGRIEDPAIIADAIDEPTPIDPERLECLAWWDFSREIPTDRIVDREHALPGRLLNLPTRAVRGSRWTGEETNWQHAPRHYAAVHFHEDDLYDCGWQTDFMVAIPGGMASGVYGVRLALRRDARHRAVLRAAAGRHRDRADRLPGLDLHLPDLWQPPARQHRRGVSRPPSGMGRLPMECRPAPGIRRLDL